MPQTPHSQTDAGPLVLGATGKVGRTLRLVDAAGLWPGGAPLWQHRSGRALSGMRTLCWDVLDGPAPDAAALAGCRGVIVLAGVTGGDATALTGNSALALAAVDLSARHGLGPVLVASSGAVYGRRAGAVTEDMPLTPANPYGKAKAAMEAAVTARLAELGADAPAVCCLRIGNVAGADQLFAAMSRGPVTLDRFADGQGPRRAYIGPVDLGRVLAGLLARGAALPSALNIAARGLVAMQGLLDAAGAAWRWVDAPPTALPELRLDTTRLAGLLDIPLPPAEAADLVAQARLGGWEGVP